MFHKITRTYNRSKTNNTGSHPNNHFDYLARIVCFGGKKVGKTSLAKSFHGLDFVSDYRATIALDYFTREVKIDDATVKLQLWDCSGDHRYATIVQSYARGSETFMLVYDVTDPNSLEEIKFWNDVIRTNTTEKDAPIILVGNKCDLIEQRRVSFDMALQAARNLGINYCTEVSAKTGANVEIAFVTILADFLKRRSPSRY